MPPPCVCSHSWSAHFNPERLTEWPCLECEDLAYFEDIQPLEACIGYLPDNEAKAA